MDNGGEFIAFTEFLEKSGISQWRSCPYAHYQMGIVERQHRHIVDTGLSLMHHARLLLCFWNFAFSTAAFLYNKQTSSVFPDETSYQRVFGQIPNLKGIQVFGSTTYPNLRLIRRNKMAFQTDPHIFVGYPRDYRGYMLYNPKLQRVILSNDVEFFETDFSRDVDSGNNPIEPDLDPTDDISLWVI